MSANPLRPIRLIADDYALAPGVSLAIIELAEMGRLSGTGAMTISPFWVEHADWIRPLADRVAIGLHFTLTDRPPLGPMPTLAPQGRLPGLNALLLRSHLGRIDASEIAAELARQIDAFERALGRSPAFLDGHQHVHVLPGVREPVLAALRGRLKGAWLRDVTLAPRALLQGPAPTKAALIAALGLGLAWAAHAHNIPMNRGFRGIHDFSGRVPYPVLFRRFLAGLPAGGLVMCHPGRVDDALRRADPLTLGRERELAFFLSQDFPKALAEMGVAIESLSSPPPIG
ncbi:MAG: ChbG/HpnK family deacetylase [Rhodospirillales bacterium]|nr:ChbG/HpnK family deacetylase [Rhodospirillales bacterium]